jgi:hypothetical protein
VSEFGGALGNGVATRGFLKSDFISRLRGAFITMPSCRCLRISESLGISRAVRVR